MTPTGPAPVAGRRRWVGRVAVVAAVVAMHACVMRSINDSVIDFDPAKKPARIELVAVQEMAFSAPPVFAPLPPPPVIEAPPPRAARQAAPVAEAASAPAVAASAVLASAPELEPEPEPVAAPEPVLAAAPAESAASTLEPVASAPSDAAVAASPAASLPTDAVAASVPASAPAAASASTPASTPEKVADTFGWPPSTRISYELTGNYRGEVYGSAQVDWVRIGERYQVHLDVVIGATFAPLYSRRMSSDGRLTDAGLVPERYDEESKAAFKDRKRASVTLEPDAVVLNNGTRIERVAGVQDTASQFVQLTYLFTRHPELLKPGGTIELPLALPRRMSRWTYDIREAEPVTTPFGAIDAVPLHPRRESRKGDELSATVWFAPSLKYLPIRIRIQQDAETYLDLTIKQRPQLTR